MSLSAAQRAILRDMASGAELTRMFYPSLRDDRYELNGKSVNRRSVWALQEAGLIDSQGTGVVSTYALTPAGAAAAGEGAE